MDNPTRSERTRTAALRAALTIIARDGPSRLTLDAIAKESGVSKGGVMHQFRTKEHVLRALLDLHITHFDDFGRRYYETAANQSREPMLATQIAILEEAATAADPTAFALLGAIAQDPTLLDANREVMMTELAKIRAEATDPDLAVLRWAAGQGLALSMLFGICPLPRDELLRLFARLLDTQAWAGCGSSPDGTDDSDRRP